MDDDQPQDDPRPADFPDTVGDAQHDQLGRVDTSQFYPPFLERLNAVLNACVMRGAIYVGTCGNRTWPQQDALYAIGRTVAPIGPQHIVTKAQGGQSSHNFGGACDLARHLGDAYAGKLIPDYRDASYQILADEAERAGLVSGLHFPAGFVDAQHVQLPVKQWGYTWAQLAAIYRQGGLAAVYAEFDKHGF